MKRKSNKAGIAAKTTIGVHAANPANFKISDTGNPAGTYGVVRANGTFGIALDAATGKVWVSDAAGAFAGSPAAGTSPDATVPAAYLT